MQEMFCIWVVFDSMIINVMVVDSDFNIVYMNYFQYEMMKFNEDVFWIEFCNFNVDELVGKNIDVFYKNFVY